VVTLVRLLANQLVVCKGDERSEGREGRESESEILDHGFLQERETGAAEQRKPILPVHIIMTDSCPSFRGVVASETGGKMYRVITRTAFALTFTALFGVLMLKRNYEDWRVVR
jgi:hypothetical protein